MKPRNPYFDEGSEVRIHRIHLKHYHLQVYKEACGKRRTLAALRAFPAPRTSATFPM